MEELRPDQVELLERHGELARDMLLDALAEYDGRTRVRETDAGRRLLARPRPLLVSVAVTCFATGVERRERAWQEAQETRVFHLEPVDTLPLDVLRTLRRLKLPYASPDVELLLDLSPARSWFDESLYAIAAAGRVLAESPGSPAVLAGLERLRARLDETTDQSHVVGHRDAAARIAALLAGQAPGGLLDLSVLDDRDGWVDTAREVLRAHASRRDGVQDVLAHLAAARGSHPTKRWAARAEELLSAKADTAELVRELLEPVPHLDLVPTPDDVWWPPSWLLAPGNEAILRGSAWTLRGVDDPWVVPLLGRLALRCSASSPDAQGTTALSAAVGNAAIDSLIARSATDPDARGELVRLLGEIRRRDVLKRIAGAVGEEADQTAARDTSIRRAKEQLVRAKADPRPGLEQRVADGVVRDELAPRLREIGFAERRGRTFWRRHPDRTEVVHLASIRGELVLRAGVWFAAPRRLFPPKIEDELPYPAESQCDLRAAFGDDRVLEACRRAEAWFMRWREPEGVLAFLLSEGSDDETWGHGAPESAVRSYLIGYLALEVGRSDLAGAHLELAAAWFRESLEAHGASYSIDVVEQHEAWISGLEADAQSG
jgi:hypothetical protein